VQALGVTTPKPRLRLEFWRLGVAAVEFDGLLDWTEAVGVGLPWEGAAEVPEPEPAKGVVPALGWLGPEGV
jgi:hypothetical protein